MTNNEYKLPGNVTTPESSGDISPLERALLDNAGKTEEEQEMEKAALDNADEDGDPLNENLSGDALTGEELDVPGSEADDSNEAIGEEDEENNSYSLGGDNND